MAVEILVPKLGLTMTEGTVNDFLVAPGQVVKVGDPVMTLATDKVDVEVEAEGEGIFHPAVEAGATLPPGAVVGWLLEAGEDAPAGGPAPESPAAAPAQSPVAAADAAPDTGRHDAHRVFVSPNARRVARERGVELSDVVGTGPRGRVVSEDVEAFLASSGAPVGETQDSPGRATPLVRRLATELGVDLAAVRGSGPDGRLTRGDVQRAADELSRTPGTATGTPGGATDAPVAAAAPVAFEPRDLTGLRGAIARNMMTSLHESAQLTLGHDADVTALVAVRAQLKAENPGRRVATITDFVVRAAALALREHPAMNASVRDGRIEPNAAVNVGVAVALDDGLIVPVLADADEGSLADLSARAADLAAAARAGRLSLAQLEGATFAVSSLGAMGIDFFTPIINPGNVGILGVGRVRDGVRWEGETPRRTSVMTLSITFDHRVIDGAPAAAFVARVGELLGRPLSLLAG